MSNGTWHILFGVYDVTVDEDGNDVEVLSKIDIVKGDSFDWTIERMIFILGDNYEEAIKTDIVKETTPKFYCGGKAVKVINCMFVTKERQFELRNCYNYLSKKAEILTEHLVSSGIPVVTAKQVNNELEETK